MNNSVRRITEGAMMIALMGVVLYMNLQFAGMFEAYFIWILPIPIAIYTARYDVKSGIVTSAAAVLMSFAISTGTSFFYTLTGCICGLVYGWGVKAKKENLFLLLTVMAVAIVADFLSMIVFAAFFGYDLVAETAEMMNMVTQMTSNSALSVVQAEQIEKTITRIIPTILIVSTVLSGVMEGLVTHILTNFTLKRLKFEVQKLKPVGQIEPPKTLGYICFVFAAFFMISLRYELSNVMTQVATFLGIIGFFILVFFGYIGLLFTATAYFGRKRNFFVLILIVLFLPMSLYFLMAYGFLYICTNMRQKLMTMVTERNGQNGQ